MLLRGLDDVPWSNLTHAYGKAVDLPSLIRSLRSADEAERKHAFHELFGNIWHQGTVYEATIHALPFLIELLAEPSTPDRPTVAVLVASIISGRGWHEVHWSRPWKHPVTRKPIAPPIDLDDRIAHERRVVQEIRKRGREALDLLVPFLRDPGAEVRRTVAEAFGLFPSRAETLAHALRAALAFEEDAEAREAMEGSLRLLAAGAASDHGSAG